MENNGHCEFNKMVDCTVHNCFNCGWNPAVKEDRITDWRRNSEDARARDDFYWDLLMEQHEQM